MSMFDETKWIVKRKCKKCGVTFETKSRTRINCEVCNPPVKRV